MVFHATKTKRKRKNDSPHKQTLTFYESSSSSLYGYRILAVSFMNFNDEIPSEYFIAMPKIDFVV